MTWHISIPHRYRDEPLIDALSNIPAALDGEDRTVAQQMMLSALLDGAETVGDVLTGLENASPPQRRAMLDEVRKSVGLPSTEQVDVARRNEAWKRSHAHLLERDEYGFAYMTCAHPSCSAFPASHLSGAMEKTNAKKWWCSQHIKEAAPGDMDPWVLPIRYTPSGGIEYIPEAEAEAARLEREQERFRVQHEARAAERAQDAAWKRSHDAAEAERFRPQGAGWER